MKVYIADTKCLDDRNLFDSYYHHMLEQRKNKIDSLLFNEDKNLSLGAGILLNMALTDFGVEDFELIYNEENKPYLKNVSGVYFNISHSKTKVMCVISNNEVGCDVELVDKCDISVAKRFFLPEEYENILKQETLNDKKEMFCRLWTLKESYIKALGKGFKVPLNSFKIEFEGDKVRLKQDDGCLYEFFEFDFKDGYKYAVCVKKDCEDFETINIKKVCF